MSISYEQDTQPWYRYFWPWFFIAMPLITVIAGISMVVVASYQPDGLVVDDYYKQGLAINRKLEKERRAAELGLTAQVRVDTEHRLVRLRLEGQTDFPPELQLILLHPTQAHHDREITLGKQSSLAEYVGAIADIPAGEWHIMLQPNDGDWRLTGRMPWPGTMTVKLAPVQ